MSTFFFNVSSLYSLTVVLENVFKIKLELFCSNITLISFWFLFSDKNVISQKWLIPFQLSTAKQDKRKEKIKRKKFMKNIQYLVFWQQTRFKSQMGKICIQEVVATHKEFWYLCQAFWRKVFNERIVHNTEMGFKPRANSLLYYWIYPQL